MNRKKLILLAASTLTAATIAVGGTLAYFTSTKQASNTFTIGKVDISLVESVVSKGTTSNANKWVATSATTTSGNEYNEIYPGAVLPKDPQITVSSDSEDCYVRMIVEIPNYSLLSDNAKLNFDSIFTAINSTDWKYDATTSSAGKYVLNYQKKVVKGTTAPLSKPFTEVTINSSLVEDDLTSLTKETVSGSVTSGNPFEINVKAEAIQAEGFANSTAAYAELDK